MTRVARVAGLVLAAVLIAAAPPATPPPAPGGGPGDQLGQQPPTDGSLATRWPVLLSHSWSNTAEGSFFGDELVAPRTFERWGVKKALEAGGAVVYQPDKIAYGSHEVRGRLLYRRCEGVTKAQLLCEGPDSVEVDGVRVATRDYCASPANRRRSHFRDESTCRQELKFNVICHSQGCPDSRYMLSAVRNLDSGRLMYEHVASWTSLAGANKGTALADWVLERLAACLHPSCRSLVLDTAFLVDSLEKNGALVTDATESVIALSRPYMLESTDIRCAAAGRDDCPPSFNERHPLPEGPDAPRLYQTFTARIDDIGHPCYAQYRLYHDIVRRAEGPNDGMISVDSQRFTHYGPGETGGRTPVVARWISGTSTDPARPHPGLDHMAFSESMTPGIDGVQCLLEDNRHLEFSREGVYVGIVAELARRGF